MGLNGNCNVGETDRLIRFGVGVGLIGAAWLGRDLNKWARIGMLAAAAETLYTAATRHCPVSEALGYSTCGKHEAPLLGDTLAGQLDERYPEMVGEAYEERVQASAEALSLGHA
jgi:hypothetical protein